MSLPSRVSGLSPENFLTEAAAEHEGSTERPFTGTSTLRPIGVGTTTLSTLVPCSSSVAALEAAAAQVPVVSPNFARGGSLIYALSILYLFSYPLGVTILPPETKVFELPTIIVVTISILWESMSASVVITLSSPSL